MMDDHGLSEDEANELFNKQNAIRKRKAWTIFNEQTEIKKIKQSAYYNKHLEAYIDEKGELRVRSTQEYKNIEEVNSSDDNDDDMGLDVSADKYFAVVRGTEDVTKPDSESRFCNRLNCYKRLQKF